MVCFLLKIVTFSTTSKGFIVIYTTWQPLVTLKQHEIHILFFFEPQSITYQV